MKKKNDFLLRQKASGDFDKAIRGLSKQTTPLDSLAVQSDVPISQIESKTSFRDGLMDEILRDHTGLTREELDLMMRSSRS